MTIRDAIELADEMKPNAFSNKVKLFWINALEGRVAADVFLMAPAEIAALHYTEEDMETELLVLPPHDDIYPLWLQARIDEANGEYNKYANSMQIYNEHYGNFVRWFAATYEPAQGYPDADVCAGACEHFPYYITAYGLAVKQGFKGTLDEWLASLDGAQGESVELRYEQESQKLQWKYTGGEDWQELLNIGDLRGAVVSETLESAQTAAGAAQVAQEAAEAAEKNGQTAREAAETAATSAADAQAGASQAAQEASTRANQAQQSATAADSNRAAAETAAGNAKTSETNAKASEAVAAASATAAEIAAGNAKTSEANAKTSETVVKASETNARASETAAAASAASAEMAAGNAKTSESNAKASEAAATASTAAAEAAAGNAKTSESNAKASEVAAEGAAEDAQEAKTGAEKARAAIENMLVEAITLASGQNATVSKSLVDQVVKLTFGIPAGPAGKDGAQGEPGQDGAQGPQGVSITRIERTAGNGAPGTTDTYTITLSNGTSAAFTVYNGANGEGSGDFMANGSVAMSGDLRMGGHRMTGVGAPQADDDAVRRMDLTADNVKFTDGETFQQKLDAGELTGPAGRDGVDGKDGAPGEPGRDGQDGAPGQDGKDGAQGPQGEKGDPGEKGDTGKSAFQSAVEYGYTGSEAEFYAALVSLKDAPFLPLSGGELSGNLTGQYITGTWLQGTAENYLKSPATKICVMDASGWVYHRTPDDLRSDMGAAPSHTYSTTDIVAGVTSLETGKLYVVYE